MSLQAAQVASLAQLLAPLSTALSDPDHCAALLADVGVPVDLSADALDDIAGLLPVLEPLEELMDLATRYAAGSIETGDLIEQGLPLAVSVAGAIEELGGIRASDVSALVAPLDDPATWAGVAATLPDYLFLRWVRLWHPLVFALLEFGGVISRSEPVGQPVTYAMSWEALGRLIGDPSAQVAGSYGWGATLDHVRLITRLTAVARAMGVDAHAAPLGEVVAAGYFGGTAPGDVLQLSVPLFSGSTADGAAYLMADLLAAPVPASGHGDPDAVLLTSEIAGGISGVLDLGSGWELSLTGGADAAGALGAVVSPEGTSLAGPAAVLDSSLRLATTDVPVLHLLGDGLGTRLDVESMFIEVRAGGTAAAPDLTVEVGSDDGVVLVIDPGEGDSFLAEVLGAVSLSIRTGLTMSWSASSGLRLGGQAGFSLVIPLDRTVGPLAVNSLRLALSGGAEGLVIEIASTGSLVLGPILAVVEDIGLRLSLVPAAHGGGFGSTELELAFKPPTGAGVAMDIEGILVGGGFLSLDNDIGRYAGVAQLSMLGVGLTAVGIVETQLPADPGGWSFFLSVVADFTPVPLGFGFTLNGVGGFMGLNRALDADALGQGVREGRIDSVLFPDDPLLNATRILADIEQFFPGRADCHTFGAMAKIGWGAPTLITAEVGVILSVPEVIIALVGELSCALPDPALPLLELHMGVVGVLDVAGASLSVTAAIYDSQLAGIALSGDMAMYASFGSSPYFLLSVGGYAPGWKPPASLPSSMRDLNRMAAAIDFGPTLDVGLDSYFAVTPNTVQFGAEVYASARVHEIGVDFSAEGSFGFDVQITFSPFQLVADMHAGVSIEAEGFTLLGVQLTLHLEGPQPWYGSGTAHFSFLGQDVPFHVAIGQPEAGERPPVVDLWTDVLLPALSDPAAWQAGSAVALAEVTLRGPDPVTEPGPWLGPQSPVEVRQRQVPLNRDIDAFGALAPDAGVARFDVAAAGLTEGKAAVWDPIEEFFAPAQFTAMSPPERLSAPSFELMDAGVRLTATGYTVPTGTANLTSVVLGYEQTVQDGATEGTGPAFVAMSAEAWDGQLTAAWRLERTGRPAGHGGEAVRGRVRDRHRAAHGGPDEVSRRRRARRLPSRRTGSWRRLRRPRRLAAARQPGRPGRDGARAARQDRPAGGGPGDVLAAARPATRPGGPPRRRGAS